MSRSQSRVAAVSRSQNDLPGVFSPQVTDNENSRQVSFTFFISLHVALGIHSDAIWNQLVIGNKADKDEQAVHRQIPGGPSLGALEELRI